MGLATCLHPRLPTDSAEEPDLKGPIKVDMLAVRDPNLQGLSELLGTVLGIDMDKVLFVTNSFGMGGAEKVLVDIVKALEKHIVVHILVFHNRGPLKGEMEKHCSVFTLFSSWLNYLVFRKCRLYRLFLLNRFIVQHQYKTVVGFMEGKSTDLVAEITADVRKIAWVHNDFRKLDLLEDTEKVYATYRTMDAIIFVSHDAKKAFLERFSNVKSNLSVIYNLIDENKIQAMSTEYEVERSTKFIFLNVGMLRKQKRQDRLVRIAARLQALKYDFQVQLIGGGPLFGALADLIVATGVQNCVVLLGMLENPYPCMRACDCFVLCSEYEGYGIAVKEALFLKKLVITTDVVGPREILADGRYGLIVENNEEALFSMMKSILDARLENREIEVLRNIDAYCSDNEVIRKQLIELFTP